MFLKILVLPIISCRPECFRGRCPVQCRVLDRSGLQSQGLSLLSPGVLPLSLASSVGPHPGEISPPRAQSQATKSKSLTSEEWRGPQVGEEWRRGKAGPPALRFGRDQWPLYRTFQAPGGPVLSGCGILVPGKELVKIKGQQGRSDALSPATCVTLSQPILLPGPRYSHPLKLRN